MILEVDRQRQPLARELRGEERRGVLVDRRLEEVDERHAELIGERRGEVLRTDEAQLEEHAGQRLTRSLGLFDRVLETVAREHVTFDERLSEAANLIDEQGESPSADGLLRVSAATCH